MPRKFLLEIVFLYRTTYVRDIIDVETAVEFVGGLPVVVKSLKERKVKAYSFDIQFAKHRTLLRGYCSRVERS